MTGILKRFVPSAVVAGITAVVISPQAQAAIIVFSAADATQSNSSPAPSTALTADKSVDGIFTSASRGWAMSNALGTAPYAVFPTTTAFVPLGVAPFTKLSLVLDFHDPGGSTTNVLGKFKIEATSDPSPTVASGAAWTTLVPLTATADSGNTLAITSGNEVQYASGGIPSVDRYSVTMAPVALPRITAIRLTTVRDAVLPGGGPGLASNGNFVLSDFQATAASGTVAATFIRSDQAGTVQDNSSAGLIVGGAMGLKSRALLSFDLSLVPEGFAPTEVNLDLFIKQLDGTANTDRDATWELHALTVPFVEGQATWNSRATGTAWTSPGGDFSTTLLASLTVNSGDGSVQAGDQLTFTGEAEGPLAQAVRAALASPDKTLNLVLLGPESDSGGFRNILFFHSDETGVAGGMIPTLTLIVPEPSAGLTAALAAVGLLAGSRRGRRPRAAA
jgi:hypothetical protein